MEGGRWRKKEKKKMIYHKYLIYQHASTSIEDLSYNILIPPPQICNFQPPLLFAPNAPLTFQAFSLFSPYV